MPTSELHTLTTPTTTHISGRKFTNGPLKIQVLYKSIYSLYPTPTISRISKLSFVKIYRTQDTYLIKIIKFTNIYILIHNI